MNRPVFTSFNDYVIAFPEAEHYRRWITHDGRNDVVFLPIPLKEKEGMIESCSLPGGYNWTYIGKYLSYQAPNPWFVHVNDGDDTAFKKLFATELAAQNEMNDLIKLAPFSLLELQHFGYFRD